VSLVGILNEMKSERWGRGAPAHWTEQLWAQFVAKINLTITRNHRDYYEPIVIYWLFRNRPTTCTQARCRYYYFGKDWANRSFQL